MKNGLFVVGCVLIAFGIVSTSVGYVSLLNENSRLKMNDVVRQHQVNLLQDQLREYEFKLSSAPTYNDGYRDALVRTQAGSYKDGYEAAQIVYKTGNYQDGYHNAIDQFGDAWFANKEEAKKISENFSW